MPDRGKREGKVVTRVGGKKVCRRCDVQFGLSEDGKVVPEATWYRHHGDGKCGDNNAAVAGLTPASGSVGRSSGPLQLPAELGDGGTVAAGANGCNSLLLNAPAPLLSPTHGDGHPPQDAAAADDSGAPSGEAAAPFFNGTDIEDQCASAAGAFDHLSAASSRDIGQNSDEEAAGDECSSPERECDYILTGAGSARNSRPGSSAWFAQRLHEPLWKVEKPQTCRLTVLETCYVILTMEYEGHLSEKVSNDILKLMSAILPDGALLPRSLHVLRPSLGYQGLEKYERHACPCGKHVYEHISKAEWPEHAGDKCGHCEQNRFKRSSGGFLTPAKRCYYFGVEHAIQGLFADPEWVAARAIDRGAWRKDPGSWWSSTAAEELNARLFGALDDTNVGVISLCYDFVNLFAFQDHSVGIIGMRSEDHDDEMRSKRQWHPPLLIIPGANLPPSVDGYFRIIGEDLKRLGPDGDGFEVTPMLQQVPPRKEGNFRPEPPILSRGQSFRFKIVLAFVYADGPARAKLLKSMGSAAAYLSCWYCWLTGTRVNSAGQIDVSKGSMVMLGYDRPIVLSIGLRAPELVEDPATGRWQQEAVQPKHELLMGEDCPQRRVTPEEHAGREKAAETAQKEGNYDLCAMLGCLGKCVLLEYLPYINPLHLFMLPMFHLLFLGLVKDFLAVAMCAYGESCAHLAISDRAKRAIAKLENTIVLHGDFGRPVKSLAKYKGWLIEHCVVFVEVLSPLLFNDAVVGEQVLPPLMKTGWGHLRRALMHYLRPFLEEDPCSEEAQRAAAAELLKYGQWAERNGLLREICKYNLHMGVCQLPVQEKEMGQPMRYNDLWVESLMQLSKSLSKGLTTSEYPEQAIAQGIAIQALLRELEIQHPELSSVKETIFAVPERNKNPDMGVAELEGGMLYSGEKPSEEEWATIKNVILQLGRLAEPPRRLGSRVVESS